jgi:ribosomal protein L40E
VGVRVCPKCFAANRVTAAVCASCGSAFKVLPRKVENRDGTLEELTASQAAREAQARRIEQGLANSVEALTKLGIQRGYDPIKARRWAEHIWAGRKAKQWRSMRI